MSAAKFTAYIQICSLEAAREADLEAFDGVITIEDSYKPRTRFGFLVLI